MNVITSVIRAVAPSFGLAILTAVSTLALLIVLSIAFGGENVAHREATRCQAAYIVNIMQEIAATADIPLTNDQDISTVGIEDCSLYLTEPFVEDR